MAMAIDSVGTLYVSNRAIGKKLVRYTPLAPYDPESGEIAYNDTPEVLVANDFNPVMALAIGRTTDHLFAHFGTHLKQYDSAAGSNALIDEISAVEASQGVGLGVDSAHGRIYASSDPLIVEVFDLASPHAKIGVIEGSSVPDGKFQGPLSIAVDEGTGHVFVYDGEASRVYEFDGAGDYLDTIEHGFSYVLGAQPGVDNGPFSPNGGLNPEGRFLFVPSHALGTGRSFAFGPPSEVAATIVSSSVRSISTSEAELRASINPGNLATEYSFEITPVEEGLGGTSVVGAGELPAVKVEREVVALVDGLQPGAQYRFRVTAANELGGDEDEGSFFTYPADVAGPTACANQELRTGASALLPDCRAYELVTPADTNARSPVGLGGAGMFFTSRHASAAGDKVSFYIEGGSLPDSASTGSFHGDPYLATRGSSGWSSAYVGPTAAESPVILPGSPSADQGFSFWSAGGPQGSAAVDEKQTSYLRNPGGESQLVGRGSLGADPQAVGRLISADGGHVVFESGGLAGSVPVQLEPNAPPTGTRAVYDRTADGVTHVVSLLPDDISPAAGKDATFEGGSLDGRGLSFSIGGTLYLRCENEKTFEIGSGVDFAGVAEGGNRIFYLDDGDLFRFDAQTGEVTAFSPSGPVTPVNVSADGSSAYFVSTATLTSVANPNGQTAAAGQQNLYLSREGSIGFVGTLTPRDVEGEDGGVNRVEGLGLWMNTIGSSEGSPGSVARDPSRLTPDGNVLLFESRAALDGYDPEGHAQVYRYDAEAGTLDCLSCPPTALAATSDASLQQVRQQGEVLQVLNAWDRIDNLRSDGRRALFQSVEALVPADNDGLQDVYQWEDAGVGGCTRSSGCTSLISYGRSRRADYLYGVSQSGDDVFVLSSDLLVGADADDTYSIYDARVGGGFPPPIRAGECLGEACQPAAVAPADPTPASSSFRGSGNVGSGANRPRCRKGQRRGKAARCVKQKGARPKRKDNRK